MRHRRSTIGWTAALAALALAACNRSPDSGLLGYVEADYIYAAPVSGGRIAAIAVKRGDAVKAGSPLFALDATDETARRDRRRSSTRR